MLSGPRPVPVVHSEGEDHVRLSLDLYADARDQLAHLRARFQNVALVDLDEEFGNFRGDLMK